MAENTKNVSQREILERCLDILNNKDIEIKHVASPHYCVHYKGKQIFVVYKDLDSLYVEIDNIMFDDFVGENKKIAIGLYDKVVAKYAEQEQTRNRRALNFLNSFALGNRK